MNTIRSFILLSLLALLSPWLLAQTQDVKWKIALDSDWKWWEIHNTGLLIVQTSKSLYGIDPETEQVLWQRDDLPTEARESFTFNEEAPYVTIIAKIAGTGTANKVMSKINPLGKNKETVDTDREIILDAYRGVTLFDSKGSGIKRVADFYALPNINKMLIIGRLGGKPGARLIDLSEGEMVWEADLSGGKSAFGMFLKESTEDEPFTLAPEADKDGHIIIPFPSFKKVAKYDGQTGSLIWEKEIGVLQDAYISPDGSKFMVLVDEKDSAPGKAIFSASSLKMGFANLFKDWMSPSILLALNTENGEEVWRNSCGVFNFLLTYEENMVLGSEGRLRMVDYNTGQLTVEYGLDKGENIETFRFTDVGLLVASSNNDRSFLYLFAKDGSKKWKSEALSGRFYQFEISGKNVYLMTGEQLGAYSLSSGSPVMRKNVVFGTETEKRGSENVTFPARRIILPDAEKKIYILYTEGKIYRVDLALGETKEIIAKINFKGDGEDRPFKLDKVEGGYLLSSKQNLLAFDAEGNILYQKYYNAPGSAFGRALGRFAKNFALFVGRAALTVYLWTDFLSYGPVSQTLVAAYQVTAPVRQVLSAGYVVEQRIYNFTRPVNQSIQRNIARARQIKSALNPKSELAVKRIIERREKEASFSKYKYIFARNEDKTEGLYQVDIRTNKELAFLPFDDKTPEYEIDYVNGNLYFLSKKNEISVFELVQSQ
ncbi:MAG: PQQ-binding-like beta-propeller repeat protein [Microscillaceae bacterium]|nr:PQQ-binding-like beta-propeller repeat protein [Microscillaceae bacterium]